MLKLCEYGFANSICISHHFIIPEPDNLIPECLDNLCPIEIMNVSFWPSMRCAIKFNHQFAIGTHEICYVLSEWHLPLEFPARQTPTAKSAPEKLLGITLYGPQMPRKAGLYGHELSLK